MCHYLEVQFCWKGRKYRHQFLKYVLNHGYCLKKHSELWVPNLNKNGTVRSRPELGVGNLCCRQYYCASAELLPICTSLDCMVLQFSCSFPVATTRIL